MLTERMTGPGEQRNGSMGELDRGSMFPGVYSSSGFDMLKILVRGTKSLLFHFLSFPSLPFPSISSP